MKRLFVILTAGSMNLKSSSYYFVVVSKKVLDKRSTLFLELLLKCVIDSQEFLVIGDCFTLNGDCSPSLDKVGGQVKSGKRDLTFGHISTMTKVHLVSPAQWPPSPSSH